MAKAALEIDCLTLSAFQVNSYIVRPSGASEAWVVDPGLEMPPLLERLAALKAQVVRIVLTHGHADHIAGIEAVKRAYPQAVITAPAGDAFMHADTWANLSAPFGFPLTVPAAEQVVHPGEELTLGPILWRVLDASGHTLGGVSYYCPAEGVVIVGDALFAGSIGRTDFPGADSEQLRRNIRRNLLSLPPATRVLPGHGPATTIADEAASNPFL